MGKQPWPLGIGTVDDCMEGRLWIHLRVFSGQMGRVPVTSLGGIRGNLVVSQGCYDMEGIGCHWQYPQKDATGRLGAENMERMMHPLERCWTQ